MMALKPGIHVPLLFILALAAAFWLLRPPPDVPEPEPPAAMILWCDEAFQAPVDEWIEAFQRRTGLPVEPHYAPSGEWRRRIRPATDVDLIMTANEEVITYADEAGLLAKILSFSETSTVAEAEPGEDSHPTMQIALFHASQHIEAGKEFLAFASTPTAHEIWVRYRVGTGVCPL